MRTALLILSGFVLAADGRAQSERRLEFHLNGVPQRTVYLANYYGNRLYYNDSAVTDANGDAVFARKSGYAAGLYAILLDNLRFEVVLNEPLVRLAGDLKEPGKVTVTQSRENELYQERKRIADDAVDRNERLLALVRQNPGTTVALMAGLDMAPERLTVHKPDGSMDSTATADHFLSHYWDNVDLTDERLPNIPGFQNRLDEFLGRDVPQLPEPLNHHIDAIMARTGGSGPVFRFLAEYLTTKYEKNGAPDMDAVFVHLAQRYICTAPTGAPGKAWSPAEQWDKVCNQAREKAPIVVGGTARNLILADTTERNWIALHKMPQECVVVVFWSPHCSHCKQALPLLYTEYKEKLEGLDVGVYAVAETRDGTLFNDWKSFVREKGLDWVNVAVPWNTYGNLKAVPDRRIPSQTNSESLRYAETWAVSGTPRYFVLDGQRRIIAKPTSINDIIKAVRAHKARSH